MSDEKESITTEVSVRAGEYHILSSETAIPIQGHPIEFIFRNSISGEFIFLFEFVEDREDQSTRIQKHPYEGRSMKLQFINYNNSLGLGTDGPIYMGILHQRELLLQARIFSSEDGIQTMHYTWYLGKDVTG